MIASVNRILFRRSATLNMFRRLESTIVPLGRLRSGAGASGDLSTPVLPVAAARAQSRRDLDVDLGDYLVVNDSRTDCPWPAGGDRPTGEAGPRRYPRPR